MSNDGRVVINAFYVPHQFEVLSMFNDLEVNERRDGLLVVLGIVSGRCCRMYYTCITQCIT